MVYLKYIEKVIVKEVEHYIGMNFIAWKSAANKIKLKIINTIGKPNIFFLLLIN